MSRIIVRNLLVLSSPRNNVRNRHQSDQDIHRSKSREYFSSKFNEESTHTVRTMALAHLERGEGEMIGVEVGKTGAKLRT